MLMIFISMAVKSLIAVIAPMGLTLVPTVPKA